MLLGSCVQTTRYTMLSPSTANATAAVNAARNVGVANGVVVVCDVNRGYVLYDARIEGDAICGLYHQHNQAPQDRCFPIGNLTAISEPRNSTAFGYFVVPIFPTSCEVSW